MKIIIHSFFWICIVGLLTFLFGRSYSNYSESFCFVSMLLPVVVGTAYFFNYFLVPNYLLKKKYFKFSLYVIYLLIISLNCEMYVITGAFIVLAEYKYANMNPISTDVFILTLTLYFVVFVLSFIRLVSFYFRNQNFIQHYQKELAKNEQSWLTIKQNRKSVKVDLDEIFYIESLSDYVKIHTHSGKHLVVKEKISSLTEKLPNHFLRIHRSFLVNQIKIESYNKEHIFILDEKLPISRTYKKSVQSSLNT